MGTSTTPNGPSDRPGLLPDWAQFPTEDNAPENTPGETPVGKPDSDQEDQAETIPSAPPRLQDYPRFWQNAKSGMTRWVNGGGGREDLGSRASGYVNSKGGARAAASASRSGRIASSRLGGFLSSVSTRGVSETLRYLGLSDLVGQDAETVLTGISNNIAPVGRTKEEAAARLAINDVLGKLFIQYVQETGDITNLDQLDEVAVVNSIKDSITLYIYYRWLDDLGKSIENGAVSETKAIDLECQIRDFVRYSLELAVEDQDIMKTNWSSREAQRIIDGIYQDAYAILEASQ